MGNIPGSPSPPLRFGPRAILLYGFCDAASGWLTCAMLIFSPWAFGTTQPWSIGTMNIAGFALGLLLLLKWLIRNSLGYRPPRWEFNLRHRPLVIALTILTVAILAYCLIAALNFRAIYDPWRMDFTFGENYIPWLPHSYDRDATFRVLINYAALACSFWAAYDWLLGKSSGEIRAERLSSATLSRTRFLPTRLRVLLFVLTFNATLLAIEAIAQRLAGSDKLLWLVVPRINKEAISQFGPYAYRANGAQYFNLLWPIALALWWTLRREARANKSGDTRSKWRSHLLLPCVVLIAACPIISTSRGGAAVAIGGLTIAAIVIVSGLRRRHPVVRFGALLFFAAALSVGLWLGWEKLSPRLNELESYHQREATYETARQIPRDYPWFGTGPGTFASVFHLYRSSTEEYWPAQLHNDWLETRITFGWIGSGLIFAAFALVFANWWLPGKIQSGWRMPSLLWLAIAGCLVHARYDFPLQVYSILHVFLITCAILFALSRRTTES